MSVPQTMTACRLWGVGDLRVEQVEAPRPQPGQVVLKVCAAGICGSDVERVFTKGTYHYPTIIGHEFAGRVVDACDADAAWLGRRAAVFPLIPCGACPACLEGRYAQCSRYDYYGSRRDGGFAEYLAVRTWNLLPIPGHVPYEAAAMLEPAAVALHALRQAGTLAGRSVAIFGVGAIALIMAQAARAWGCRQVILVARSEPKAGFARALGLGDVVQAGREPVQQRIRELTAGRGVDIAVEGCGAARTLSDALTAAAPFGTVVCMGNPVEDMTLERDVYWQILRKQLRLCGTWNSSYKVAHNDWEDALDLLAGGRLDLQGLITGRYPLARAQEAFDAIREKRGGVHIKTMFITEGEER